MFDYTQLHALLAVEETGTYEGAARELNVTSFAVKQRIKTLEAKLGVRLVESSPTRTSEVGRILCGHTREVRALEEKVIEDHRQDCLDEGKEEGLLRTFPIAVCDEVFSEWFVEALDEIEKFDPVPTVDISLAPRKEIVSWMQTGKVIASLSHHDQDIYGFKSYPLGQIEYRAVASPDYFARVFEDGVTAEALTKAPCYRFCGNDDLAYEWVERVIGKPTKLQITRYPSSDGALKACMTGRIWSMHPTYRIADALASSDLIELIPQTTVARPLVWHVTGAMVETLKPFTSIIRQTAKSVL